LIRAPANAPAAADAPTCVGQVGDVARDPDARHRGRARRIGGDVRADTGRVLDRLQAEVGEEPGAGDHPGGDHEGLDGNDGAVAQADAGDAVVVDLEARHLPSTDRRERASIRAPFSPAAPPPTTTTS
jgi:hypothetical protein